MNLKSKLFFILALTVIVIACKTENNRNENILYKSDSFTIYNDSVIQGDNKAVIISPKEITSNYSSPTTANYSNYISFKLTINEKDIELPSGKDHHLLIESGQTQSPIIVFGEMDNETPTDLGEKLTPNYQYTFRADMNPVLRQFEKQGYYVAYDGSRFAKQDFKGFYIAGGSKPLTWDFSNLEENNLELIDKDGDGIYEITLTLNPFDESANEQKTWQLTKNISSRPKYTSQQHIVDALFNLSMEEAIKNIEPDSTLRTGAKWGGVWTRDVSYSILLAFSYHEPEVAKISLRKKVNRGRIIQDTGSGGAWPVSSDRTTWCLAAWEIYKVTGDKAWLDEVYPIIKNTLEDDYKTIYDSKTGMYSGESSFLDWREQTYPKWMDNRDIYVSENLGTNVVHYQAHRILAEMAKTKGEPYEIYEERANEIKKGINDYLWMKDKGYYAQYLYGRDNLIVSPRYEALGESLAILFEVANEEQATSIISKSPLTEFGATCIYPQIPGIPPYHNNGIWPFVQSYWNWAAAKTGNGAVLNHGLASIYRASGLFLTNYENMVAETGDFLGTEINSHQMLWSMAGNLAMVHRIFMGMDFKTDGLYFNPVVPKAYGGNKTLSNFKYRNAVLNITVNGFGTKIKSVTIDGEYVEEAFISNEIRGNHNIVIELANNEFPHQNINRVENHFTLPTVLAKLDGDIIKWQPINGVKEYCIYKNGAILKTTMETQVEIESKNFNSYMVSTIDNKGYEGFASEPIWTYPTKSIQVIEAENSYNPSKKDFINYTGTGFIELSMQVNKEVAFPINVDEAGQYIIDFRYSNGSGAWNTDKKCAIRSLYTNGQYSGSVVLPQRGKDEWSDWGYSNSFSVKLNKGENQLVLKFEDWNNNMDIEVNTAMLDNIRVIKL